MSFSELEKLLNLSWSKETCNPRFCDMWTSDNPSLGQSDVTSLVVYNFYGGKIMRCNTSIGDHYYNLVDDNILDLTVEEFMAEKPNYKDPIEITDNILYDNSEIRIRNDLLMDNIIKNFLSYKKYKLTDGEGKEYLSYEQGSFCGNRRTKIFGKLDCSYENNWFTNLFVYDDKVYFASVEDALSAGFKPCRFCMPNEYEEYKKSKKEKKLKLKIK